MTKILVVDHDERLARLYSTALLEDGHDVMIARDSVEALELLETEPPQLVVLNLSLQCTGGIAPLMTYFDRNPGIPIVSHAGRFGRALSDWALAKDSCLLSSSDVDALRTMIRRALDGRRRGLVLPFNPSTTKAGRLE